MFDFQSKSLDGNPRHDLFLLTVKCVCVCVRVYVRVCLHVLSDSVRMSAIKAAKP